MVIENGDLSNGKEVEKDVDSLKNSFVVDIGAKAIEDYEKILKVRHSSVNIINGGCGFHEGGFVNGTVKIFEHTMNNGCFVAIVGGDANLTWNMHVVDLGEPDVKSTAGKAFLNAVVHDELPLKKFMEM
jgi:3-phosphoglycerate kinase